MSVKVYDQNSTECTRPDWVEWNTDRGELNLYNAEGVGVTTFAAGSWLHVADPIPDTEPLVLNQVQPVTVTLTDWDIYEADGGIRGPLGNCGVYGCGVCGGSFS